jgi:hypothetical protein
VPSELGRFQELPMQVTWRPEAKSADCRILRLLEVDEIADTSVWGLADVKANRKKGVAKLGKREAGVRFNVPISSIQHVRLHLDA